MAEYSGADAITWIPKMAEYFEADAITWIPKMAEYSEADILAYALYKIRFFYSTVLRAAGALRSRSRHIVLCRLLSG